MPIAWRLRQFLIMYQAQHYSDLSTYLRNSLFFNMKVFCINFNNLLKKFLFINYYHAWLRSWTSKGLLTNFEYITFFSCPTDRNIFYKKFISIKPLWLEIIEKKGYTKSVRVYIYNIYNSTRSDWLCAPSFLN